MARTLTPAELGRGSVKPTKQRIRRTVPLAQVADRDTRRALDNVVQAVNESASQEEFGNYRVSVTFAAPATDTPVSHGVPGEVGYTVVSSSAAMRVYTGSDPSETYPKGVLWLRSDAAGTAILHIFRI